MHRLTIIPGITLDDGLFGAATEGLATYAPDQINMRAASSSGARTGDVPAPDCRCPGG